MCCDWQPKLPKAKSVRIIAKPESVDPLCTICGIGFALPSGVCDHCNQPKSVVPPIKVRILELSYGTNIVLLDDGRDFTKLYKNFYVEKQKLSYDMDIMEYLISKGVTILEAQQDHIVDLINYVNKLHEKVQEEKEKQAKKAKKAFITPCDCPRCS